MMISSEKEGLFLHRWLRIFCAVRIPFSFNSVKLLAGLHVV